MTSVLAPMCSSLFSSYASCHAEVEDDKEEKEEKIEAAAEVRRKGYGGHTSHGAVLQADLSTC